MELLRLFFFFRKAMSCSHVFVQFTFVWEKTNSVINFNVIAVKVSPKGFVEKDTSTNKQGSTNKRESV